MARFTANGAPRAAGRIAFTFDDPRFVPEGIAYDPRDGSHYLGSVRERRIVRIDANGMQHAFVDAGRDGLMSALGMRVDTARGLLWVSSAALPEMDGYRETDAGASALFAFRLADGALDRRVALPPDGGPHAFGDLALAAGRVFVSDQLGGPVYAYDPAGGQLAPFSAPGSLVSPQGIVPSAAGDALIVADYAQGLMRIALADGSVRRILVPETACTYGIDGLAGDGARLVAVQNGIRPARVLSLAIDPHGDRVAAVRVLAQADPRWSEPNLGVLDGRRFRFVANSQWDRFDDAHQLRDQPPLEAPRIIELELP